MPHEQKPPLGDLSGANLSGADLSGAYIDRLDRASSTPSTITPAQFRALCAFLWGEQWRHDAAGALGVALRNVQFWAAEPPARGKPVPPGVARELVELAGREFDAIRAKFGDK